MSIPDLELTARLVGVSFPELWTRYLGVGGTLSLDALVARIAGEREWPPREDLFLAVALNDALIDESLGVLNPLTGLQSTCPGSSAGRRRAADLEVLCLRSWNSRTLARSLCELAQEARRRAAGSGVPPSSPVRSDPRRLLLTDARRLDSLVQDGGEISWRADAAGRMLESPSWGAFTGQSTKEWAGRGWLDAVHPADRRHAEQNWQLCVGRDQPVRTHLRLWSAAAANWQLTRVRAVPVHGAHGQTTGWVGTNAVIGGAPVPVPRGV